MGLFDNFPYTNFHELNLDWILKMLQQIDKTMSEFVAINALKYADPIQWDITSQYEKNTIVIDPQTGTAYISVQPVPIGVTLYNTDYWTVVFDLGSFVTKAAKNFTDRYEDATTLTATFDTPNGYWLVWADVLYIALSDIHAGDQYVIGSNIRHITMEEIIYDISQAIGDLALLNTSDTSSIVNAINSLQSDIFAMLVVSIKNFTTRYEPATNTEATFATSSGYWLIWGNTLYRALTNISVGDSYVIGTNIEAITMEQIVGEISNAIGDLSLLNTSDTSNIVNAINSLVADMLNMFRQTLANFTSRYEPAANTEATFATSSGYWLIWGNTLYRALTNISIGDSYVIGTNIEAITIDQIVGELSNAIGNLANLTTTDKSSVVNAINEIDAKVRNLVDRRYILIGDSYLEGAHWHNDGTWTYDIKDWGAYFDEFMGVTSIRIAVSGAGIGGQLYDSWINAFNNATIPDPDTITDIIVGGSANDIGIGCSVSDMITGASNLMTAIKTRCPNARVWIADIGISINPANITQSQLVHTVYTWFGQFGYIIMGGTKSILNAADRVQGDGVHPEQLGEMFIALAMVNNILGITYTDYKNGFSASLDGMNFLFTQKNGVAYVVKSGSEVVSLGTPITGTFSGIAGVNIDLGTIDSDYWVAPSTTYNFNSVPGYVYIGPDIYPAIFQFAFISGHFYMYPIVMQGTGYYTGTIATLIVPSFSINFSDAYI